VKDVAMVKDVATVKDGTSEVSQKSNMLQDLSTSSHSSPL
jgi:hypothetical protein